MSRMSPGGRIADTHMGRPLSTRVLSGFVGGLLGAYVLVNGERATLLPKAEHQPAQEVISASRIRLLDATGKRIPVRRTERL